MKIDHSTKTIILESSTDRFSAFNYLTHCVRDRKEWKLKTIYHVKARQTVGSGTDKV